MANHQDNFAQQIAQSEHTSNLPEPVWLLDDGGTYEEALSLGQEIREEALKAISSLPRKDVTKFYPPTMSDALSLVHARDDAKRKAGITKSTKVKQRSLGASLLGSDDCFPGAVEGGGDQYAFWMYLEDCFRDVTQEDLHDIVPLLRPPSEDPAFTMSAPGSGTELATKIAPLSTGGKKQLGKQKSTPAIISPPLMKAEQRQQQQQQKKEQAKHAEETPLDAAGLSERRSRRLGSKSSRGVSYAFADDDVDFALDDEELEIREAIALAEAAAASISTATPATAKPTTNTTMQQRPSSAFAASTTPMQAIVSPVFTPQGAAATVLWDVLSDVQLARLAVQIIDLGKVVVPTSSGRSGDNANASLDSKTVKALTACVDSNGASSLDAAVRSAVQLWLEMRTSALADTLGCKTSVLILPSRKGDDMSHVKKKESGDGVDDNNTTTSDKDNTTIHQTITLPSTMYHHPYTQLIMKNTVAEHIRQQAVEPLPVDPQAMMTKTPTSASLLGLTGAPSTGTVNSAGVQDGAGDTSTMGTPALSGMTPATQQQGQQNGVTTDEKDSDGAAGEDAHLDSGTSGGRQAGGRQRAVSNYALLAGKKDPAKAAAAAAARKLSKEAAAVLEAQVASQHPVARAVAISIAEGAEEGAMAAQFEVATQDMKLLAAAPQDELAAETLALQAELASVVAANRMRLLPAVRAMLEDLPRQEAAAEIRSKEEHDIKSWVMGMREARRKEIKQRREAAQREAISTAAQQGSDVMAGAVPFHHALDNQDEEEQIPFLGPDELFDVYAQRKEEDEAFCAVCTDGSSVEPNVILFCDRCDIAVHQRCYDVDVVPEHEWLCWPCREHEAALLAQGVPQMEIRKPHMMPEDRKKLTGGAREATCALCPIKLGAFRKTSDGSRWVHQTCALWHPETYMVQGNGANVVEGLNKIPQKRWTTPCDICGRSEGAVINCKHPGTCQYSFHVLCARNCGLYLTVRKDLANKLQYRIYCPMHSKAQREKDRLTFMTAQQDMQNTASKAALRKAEEQQRQLAINQLRLREAERDTLALIRDQTEKLRVLLDQCKRREKLKKQLIQATSAVHAERMTYPEQALEFIGKIDELEKKGLTPDEIMHQVMDLSHMATTVSHTQIGGGGGAIVTMQQNTTGGNDTITTAAAVHNENTINTINTINTTTIGDNNDTIKDNGGVAVSIQRHEATGVRGGPSLQDDQLDADNGGGDNAINTTNAMTALPQQPAPINTTSKRKRDTAAATIASTEQQQETTTKKQRGTATASSDQQQIIIERQKMMSSAEAAEWNKKFPPDIKYVLADQLAGTSAATPRGARAAARAAGGGGGNVTPKQQEQQEAVEGTRVSSRIKKTKE